MSRLSMKPLKKLVITLISQYSGLYRLMHFGRVCVVVSKLSKSDVHTVREIAQVQTRFDITETPYRTFEWIGIDLIGPYMRSPDGNRSALI